MAGVQVVEGAISPVEDRLIRGDQQGVVLKGCGRDEPIRWVGMEVT
jgi:hypothetical protein